jgi:DNA (cytosine-5)-methyltransferase 1
LTLTKAVRGWKKGRVGQNVTEIAPKRWPTPTVDGNYNKAGLSAKSGDGLATAVKQWATPTANDAKQASLPKSQGTRSGIPGDMIRAGEVGSLNPTWVEWLMGWPLGWTDLKPLGMDKFREWRRQHGGC